MNVVVVILQVCGLFILKYNYETLETLLIFDNKTASLCNVTKCTEMTIYDKLKPYLIHLKVISLVSSGSLLFAYSINGTVKNINKIVNTKVLNREIKFTPEYIYIDDPLYNTLLEKERRKEYKSLRLPRFLKHLKRSLEWRLLRVCRNGNREQRNLALEQLAAFKNNRVWDYWKIAQALDQNTAVLLARTKGADERYFLPPPIHIRRSAKLRELSSFKIRDMLLIVQSLHPHSCIRHFLSKYFTNVQDHVMDAESIPAKPDHASERELCLFSLDALHHQLNLFELNVDENKLPPSDSLIKVGLFPLLAEILVRYRTDVEMEFAIVRILKVLSVHTYLLTDFFQNGLIGELARMLHSTDIRLSSSAAVCLTNLSGECCFKPSLFLLHPIYRTSQPHTCDTLLVHGLRGDVFTTWRQRDKEKCKDSSVFGSHQLSRNQNFEYIADPELEQAMGDLGKLRDERLLSDYEVVLHDLPVSAKRDLSQDYEYLTLWKRESLIQEQEDLENTTLCWPKEWLPKDCNSLRIIGVNYWTSLSEWLGWCSLEAGDIASRAQNLMPALCEAGVGSKNIPVIWLAHSMGGLIVKQLLVNSVQSEKSVEKEISDNTRAVLFFSTPHRGSALATMPRAAAAILWPSTDVRQLQVNSPVLLALQETFIKVAEERNWESISFSETKSTLVTTFKVPVHFVDAESADFGRGVFYQLPLDHFSICKPATRQSVLYTTVVNVIQHNNSVVSKFEQSHYIMEFVKIFWQMMLKRMVSKLWETVDETNDDFYSLEEMQKILINAFIDDMNLN